jgi:hypothetical protein
MHTRRITLTVGAAGAGLLATALLQTAVAFATTGTDTAVTIGTASGSGGGSGSVTTGTGTGTTTTVTTGSGSGSGSVTTTTGTGTGTTPPAGPTPGDNDAFTYTPSGPETGVTTTGDLPYFGTSTGTELYDVNDTSLTGDPLVGTADATVHDIGFLGVTNSDAVFTTDLPTPGITGTTGDPEPGSFIDTTTFGDTGDYNVLTEITAVGGETYYSDVFYTNGGDYTVPPALDAILVDIYNFLDIGGATATTGAADGVGTAAVDGFSGLLADLGSIF